MNQADNVAPSRRERRRERNDRLVLDATASLLASQGWSTLSVRAVAREAGVSEQLLRNRYVESTDLALRFWRDRGSASNRSHLDPLIQMLPLRDAAPPPDPDVAAPCLEPFVDAETTLQAAMELVIVAHFDERIRLAVMHELGAFLAPLVDPHGNDATASPAAQRAYAITRALGLTILGRWDSVTRDEMTIVGHAFASAVKRTPPPTIPDDTATHLDPWFAFATGDARKDALLEACHDLAAEEGLDEATLTTMVKRAGVDINHAYRTFSRKVDVFIEASKLQRAPSIAENQRFRQRVASQHG